MSNPLSRAWRRLVEGSWAHGLANRVGVPKGRREQLRLDMQRAWLAAQVWRLNQRNAPPSVSTYQQLLLHSKVIDKEETFPFVAEHLRNQILGMAAVLHTALEKAGDALPAARAMLQARAAIAGHGQADACTGKAYLSQLQVSELMRKHWGYSLQVRPSTVDQPDAGLGLFVQGRAPVGAVVALLPGIVYSRTQLSRMPNFPKVALDNPYLSSTIEMNVIDSKPWGLGVKVQQNSEAYFARNLTSTHEAGKAETGPATSDSNPSNCSGGHVDSRDSSSSSSSSNSSSRADKTRVSEPTPSPFSSHSPTAPHPDQDSPQASASYPLGTHPVKSMVYPSEDSASQPPLLGYMSAYSQQADGRLVPARDCGSWALAALEERHPLAWAHMANHPGPGMQPNVLEVPFEIDLGPPVSEWESGEATEARNPPSAGQSNDDGAFAQAERWQDISNCPPWLRAYIPCVPFSEPVPPEELAEKGWRQAAAEVLLESCGWPNKARKSKQNGEEEEDNEEEQVGFRLPGLPAAGGSSSRARGSASKRKGMPVQGMALVATQAIQDGEEVLLNYRLSPHTPRPSWYHSLDPEAEARRWAQMPLKGLLS